MLGFAGVSERMIGRVDESALEFGQHGTLQKIRVCMSVPRHRSGISYFPVLG